jgi:hypothetical protein
MYEIIKHTKKQTTTLFTTPCEAIAKTRFAKSAGLLKLNESLELLHQGQVIDSAKKELAKAEDEDEDIIFPEAPSTWGRVGAVESLMKSLYCIAGSLPAQFRSSAVDCGIGWKEHAKQEPRKAKTENIALEMEEQIEERLSIRADIEAFIQASVAVCKNYQPPLDKPPVLVGIDPAAKPKPSIDLSTIKPGDKVMLVDGKTFQWSFAKDFTVNGIYTVCAVDLDDSLMSIRVYDDVGDRIWVFTEDVRIIGVDPGAT